MGYRTRRTSHQLAPVVWTGGTHARAQLATFGPTSLLVVPGYVTRVSSFWTPGGEHPIGSDGGVPDDNGPEPDAGGDDLTPQGRARLLADATAVTAELAATPAGVVVANHVVGLFQLAAIHLNEDPPHLDDGRLAIDAVKGILDAVGERLGDDGEALRTGLTQLQLAYVELHRRGGAPPETGAPPAR